jgi:hypothetical protein
VVTTQTLTITEFLLARIAEREALARAASHGGARWTSPKTGYGSGRVDAVDRPADDVGIVVYDEGRPSEDQAAHIAFNDPARVLAECEAHRRIVREARQAVALSDETPDDDSPRAERIHGAATAWSATLDALATIYADHEDFREEWRA